MFAKQHYKAIADIIMACNVHQDELITPGDLVNRLADYFARDNSRFNKEKWFDYLQDQT